MLSELIETGKIVNTHGIRGELRLQPWADSPERLLGLSELFIDGKLVKVINARVHKRNLIVKIEGVDGLDAAIKLKNKTVCARRSALKPDDGSYFIADLIGLRVEDAETGEVLGVLRDVLTLPANNVYVIKGDGSDAKEILVPAVPEFISETNLEEGYVKLNMIEGL